MRILHISDIHFLPGDESSRPSEGPDEQDHPEFNALWLGPAGALAEMAHFREGPGSAFSEGENSADSHGAASDGSAATPGRHNKQLRFDAIVISGDLTSTGSLAEFERLLHPLRSQVRKLVKNEDLRRVVLVPGNHDVNWSQDVYLSIPPYLHDEVRHREWRRVAHEDIQALGGDSKYREYRTAENSQYFELDDARYQDRMKNFEWFYKEFYQNPESPENRADGSPNGKASETDDVHFKEMQIGVVTDEWSVHRIDGVAIFGFNSCHRNDRLHRGAKIHHGAIMDARRWADENGISTHKRVAVWHHGVGAEGGAVDELPMADLGALYNAGFRVGLHGHTHRQAQQANENLFRSRFVVVSAGSLGATSEERPDAVGNQFNIITLSESFVRLEVFERMGAAGVYELAHKRFVRRGAEVQTSTCHARRHVRRYFVDRWGVSTGRVTLRGVSGTGPLTLAVITPPYCRSEERFRDPDVHVNRTVLLDGRQKYTLDTPFQRHETFEWSYRVSNAYPLSQFDLATRPRLRPVQGYDRSDLGSTWEVSLASRPGSFCRPHELRIPCDEFWVELFFTTETVRLMLKEPSEPTCEPEGDKDAPASAEFLRSQFIKQCTGVIEAPSGGEVVPSFRTTSAHASLEPVKASEYPTDRRMELFGRESAEDVDSEWIGVRYSVSLPVVGNRYGIAYSVGHQFGSFPGYVERFLLSLLRVRTSTAHSKGLKAASRVGVKMLAAVAEVVGVPESGVDDDSKPAIPAKNAEQISNGLWLQGFLWSSDQHSLETAFGDIPVQRWGVRFLAGDGVAGHAFRFGEVSAWHHSHNRDHLVFVPQPLGSDDDAPKRWVLSIPIIACAPHEASSINPSGANSTCSGKTLEPGVMPIGVVSIEAGHSDESRVRPALDIVARRLSDKLVDSRNAVRDPQPSASELPSLKDSPVEGSIAELERDLKAAVARTFWTYVGQRAEKEPALGPFQELIDRNLNCW